METDQMGMATATVPPVALPQIGARVRCADGVIGTVAAVLPAWADQPTHLLVRWGPLVPETVAVPWRWITRVDATSVLLQVRRRRVLRLLRLRDDDDIAADVREALATAPHLGTQRPPDPIDVDVADGVATLRGTVRTLWRALAAEQLAAQVRGVREVRNQLIGDDELIDCVVAALQRAPKLMISRLRVEARHGAVVLGGSVPNAEQCAQALLVARRVSGVRVVANLIEVVHPPSSLRLHRRSIVTIARPGAQA